MHGSYVEAELLFSLTMLSRLVWYVLPRKFLNFINIFCLNAKTQVEPSPFKNCFCPLEMHYTKKPYYFSKLIEMPGGMIRLTRISH